MTTIVKKAEGIFRVKDGSLESVKELRGVQVYKVDKGIFQPTNIKNWPVSSGNLPSDLAVMGKVEMIIVGDKYLVFITNDGIGFPITEGSDGNQGGEYVFSSEKRMVCLVVKKHVPFEDLVDFVKENQFKGLPFIVEKDGTPQYYLRGSVFEKLEENQSPFTLSELTKFTINNCKQV